MTQCFLFLAEFALWPAHLWETSFNEHGFLKIWRHKTHAHTAWPNVLFRFHTDLYSLSTHLCLIRMFGHWCQDVVLNLCKSILRVHEVLQVAKRFHEHRSRCETEEAAFHHTFTPSQIKLPVPWWFCIECSCFVLFYKLLFFLNKHCKILKTQCNSHTWQILNLINISCQQHYEGISVH